MNEAIVTVLIGVVPSILVAVIAIATNNAITKMKLEKLERDIDKQNKEILEMQEHHWSQVASLTERVCELEREKKE